MSSSDEREIYIGLMSGTSLDGVDVAIVDFTATPPSLLHFATTGYAEDLRARLRELTLAAAAPLEELYLLDAELGELYASLTGEALAAAALDPRQVHAIGCHGQTLRHGPEARLPYTAQIGDPNRVAALSGITTVADLRRKDMALGGQGAPLAAACHAALFRAADEDRVVLNIGGIANLTWLPADPAAAVLGFDTGPGNTLLDQWAQKHLDARFDDDGTWARGGRVADALLAQMLGGEAYFAAAPPKSTGTDHFNLDWLARFADDGHAPADLQATLTELSARSIAEAIAGLPSRPAACFVCGGGAHNGYLRERIARALPQVRLATTAELGIAPDAVEAVAFAWLARERLAGRPGNLPAVTRARRPAVLGGVYRPD